MKFFLSGLLLALSSVGTCFGQNSEISAFEYMNRDIFDAVSNALKNSQKYSTVMGSLKNVPGRGYYTRDWLPGTVVTATGQTLIYRGIRYNLALQAVEVRDSSAANNVRVMPLAEVARFTLGPTNKPDSRFFEKRVYQNSQESGSNNFFESLNPNGEVQFFLLHRIALQPSAAPTSTGELRTDKYLREMHLFVGRSGQQKLSEFLPNRRNVLKLFGARANEVQAHATSNNLAYDNPQDVVAMTAFYNKLVAAPK